MHSLPAAMTQLLAPFAPLFSKCVWPHVQVLLAGAILAPGKRTVSAALRAARLGDARRFHRYHRVLSRASWSSRVVLLGLLLERFVLEGPLVVVGIDETLERRQGKIAAKGIYYRDPPGSSPECLGFETQRQCSEPALQRTAPALAPALLGLLSLVTLFAHQHTRQRARME